ncbi:MAG: hypothetical protein OEQ53_00240, partial [Saprospiraceae bacterium]|nr:hypothetical protein [Saprospiraceae bacterium]
MWKSTKNGFERALLSFEHGIHPKASKELTQARKIERVPFSEEYTLHLSQHIGAPSKTIVKEGQQVKRGELIA